MKTAHLLICIVLFLTIACNKTTELSTAALAIAALK